MTDGSLSMFFGRDMAELGVLERSVGGKAPANDKIAAWAGYVRR
jgi:hypothetical protein